MKVAVLFFALGALAGCGSSTGGSTLAAAKPSIVTQPANATVPLGQTATFSVGATGAGPLTYQWAENGTAIEGATSYIYVTPPVIQSENGAAFSVTVSNSEGNVVSSGVTLTVGPRSPLPGDLRFQQVDAPSVSETASGGIFTDVSNLETISYPDSFGTPLSLGSGMCVAGVPYDCGWRYFVFQLPSGESGLATTFSAGVYSDLSANVAAESTPTTVITSLDLKPADNTYAVEWVATKQTTGFSLTQLTVSPAGLQTAAAQEGAKGHVITALSYDDSTGMVDALSYAWQGDPSTVYSVQTEYATESAVGLTAESLAQQGYIITAFGGNSADGFYLVGTRVEGDSIPRPITVEPPYLPVHAIFGYAAVGYIDDALLTNNTIWLYEK